MWKAPSPACLFCDVQVDTIDHVLACPQSAEVATPLPTYQYGYYIEVIMLRWDPFPWIVMVWTLEMMIKGGRIVVGTPYHQINPPSSMYFIKENEKREPQVSRVTYFSFKGRIKKLR